MPIHRAVIFVYGIYPIAPFGLRTIIAQTTTQINIR